MEFTQEDIKQRLIDGLRSKASWAEILFFSTNSRLLDTVAENLSQAISYDEFLTRNTRWDLATEKSALVSQAKFRGYEPHRKIGAKGDIKYVQTLGIEGNILGTNIIDTVESTVYDEDGAQVDAYCKNTGNLDGGQDEEDIESIRVNGIDTFQAGDKAVVQKDYEVKLRQSDYILKATVWGAYEYNVDNNVDLWEWVPTEENVVKVSAFTPAGEQLTTSQQEEVIEFLKQDKPPTDIVRFYDVNFIYLAFHMQLFVQDPSYVLSDVKARVIDGVEEEYGLENIDFMQPLYDTGWKGFVNDIEGVTYHASYIEIIKYEDFNEAYLGDIDLDLTPVEIESVRVFIRDNTLENPEWEFVAQDDGDGQFIEESGYDLTGSSINYTTGEGVIDVVSGLDQSYTDYDIKVYYQVDSINIHLNERNQIFKIDEITDVTAEYLLE